jgi:hypothetical protein
MPEILHMESTADVLQRHCILHELWLDQGPARPEMIKNRPLWDSLAAVCFVFGGWGGGGVSSCRTLKALTAATVKQ